MNAVTQFNTPFVPRQWYESRETHPAVAMAIHAISYPHRAAVAIWEDPTESEWGMVKIAVDNYVDCGIFEAEQDGLYPWGEESIHIARGSDNGN